MTNWYQIAEIDRIDSPSLILSLERLEKNIAEMIRMVGGDTTRLMPHVKTNKCRQVIAKMVEQGITRFKSSTLTEAEIAAEAGASSVLIAHQLVGPKIQRFFDLATGFPNTSFSTIIDNRTSLSALAEAAARNQCRASIYIDINNGMERSGIKPGQKLADLIEQCKTTENIQLKGLHIYDGHHREEELMERKRQVNFDFEKVHPYYEILPEGFELISGGTPTFSVHKERLNRICSPGTCVFSDWGYGERFKDQHFEPAVLLVTRVISKPAQGIVTVDMGHKSVASENPVDKRISFLNLKEYELLSQSEEHGVLKVDNWEEIKIGDVFFGVPYHICPTVNLHDGFTVIKDGMIEDFWEITARKRKIRY